MFWTPIAADALISYAAVVVGWRSWNSRGLKLTVEAPDATDYERKITMRRHTASERAMRSAIAGLAADQSEQERTFPLEYCPSRLCVFVFMTTENIYTEYIFIDGKQIRGLRIVQKWPRKPQKHLFGTAYVQRRQRYR